MPSDVSVIVADNTRLAPIRDSASLPGRHMPFASSALASALASIQAYRPKVIAVDAIFAETPAGATFIEQIEPLAKGGSSILLVVENDGKWVTTPHSRGKSPSPRVAVAPEPKIVKPSAHAIAAVSNVAVPPGEIVSTRRAPRFLVKNPIDVIVESHHASLVDISVLGAQIVCAPVLRPKQKIKVDLTDADKTLSLFAHVAWSMFEMPPSQAEPHYRVGLEFTGAAQQALEKYRQRHCAAQPIPIRTR